uniref:Alpha-type protein kinase domain-containing protein n=1 Tax=Chromera velia CCMP2878 TaxID=1169474 RepID=A0A0K6S9E3_9ALVE|eukprot:Cvel_6954.t1-p1 / transcript=Cvel_6954.t1 / gene=Cvel_6954 / organism=Chromera_velia_CCMP2878 / gene_product=Alpha-protein kinase 1, putative / transcript_product=Alpha-protein kinase 1, putative / location=Cvel_scaffold352:81858-82952(-) / protein_length=365 / sequence_SO=supercontig / SO=protein_coding / is_pseudo=false
MPVGKWCLGWVGMPQRRIFVPGFKDTGWTNIPFRPDRFLHPDADGFAVRRTYFGSGSQRVVFFFRELKNAATSRPTFVGEMMLAEDSKHVITKEEKKVGFHIIYCKLLRHARKIAQKFSSNIKYINMGTSDVNQQIPTVDFLEPSIYTFRDTERKGEPRELLVEKLLGEWEKWNDNSGWVKGMDLLERIRCHAHAQVQPDGSFKLELPTVGRPGGLHLGDIREDEECESEGEEEAAVPEKEEHFTGHPALKARLQHLGEQRETLLRKVHVNDVPQALSHFSLILTRNYDSGQQALVDLQGAPPVLLKCGGGSKGSELRFELTDPAIHSIKGKFGKTNLREDGIDSFRKTHKCNALCELLGLPPMK